MKQIAYPLAMLCWVLVQHYTALAQMQVKTPHLSVEDQTWIEQNMEQYMEEYEIPALVVGIVKEGEIVGFLSRGHKKKGNGTPVDEHTIFQLASLTKSFTGILANHLIAEGKIVPEHSIVDYLPESLSLQTKEKLRPVKVSHLLHHRSGIPRSTLNGPKTPFGTPMKGGYTEAELLENLDLLSLEFEPGERFNYSNFGFSLLGYLLERASDMPYADLIQIYISDPYKLESTSPNLSPSQLESLATPYRPEWPFTKTRPWEFGRLVAAGGMYSSVSDLAHLMVAQMEAYEQFEMDGQAHPLVLTKEKQAMGSGFYGYGFMENRSAIDTSVRHFGHGGDIDGFVSNYSFCPEKKTGLIMLSSKGGRWFWELERQINKRLLGFPIPDAVPVSKEVLKKYVGEYQFKNILLTITLKGDQLWTQTPNRPRHKLYAASETEFFYKAFDAEFRFVLDDQGEIDQIFYTQNGKTTEPEKVK